MSAMDSKMHPEWLTQSYLEEILQNYLKDDTIQIQNVRVQPATASGENYASIMSRIKVSFRKTKDKTLKNLTFVMKQSYESDPFASRILGAYDVYNTEMKMYDQILPQLGKVLAEIGETEKLFAETLKVDFDKSVIMFEDLSEKNYVVVDRLKGLDETHTLMVIKKLAKFHAAATVLNERLNGELEKFDRGIFNRHVKGGIGRMHEYFTEVCADFAKNCTELGPYYYDKLMLLQPHVINYATKAYNSSNKHFHTLSHGDLWITNIMMSYSKSVEKELDLQDVLLIDFQFSNWSSPAVDLYYLFFTSLEPELMMDVENFQKLVKFYHTVLKETLRKLKFKGYIPTLHELCVQLEEGKFLAVTTLTTHLPVAIAEQCEGADFHCLVDDIPRARVFRTNCYKNKRVQEVLKVMLPYCDRHGLLDVQK